VRLFIFEPRYRQLLNEIFEHNFPFVIPFQYQGKMSNLGSMVMLKQVLQMNSDGTSHIEINGIHPAFILSFKENLNGKLYDGGTIQTLESKHIVQNKKIIEIYCALNDYEYFEHETYEYFEIARKLNLNLYDKLKIIETQDWEMREKILLNILKIKQIILKQEKSKWQNFNMN